MGRLMQRGREEAGLTIEQAARRLSITPRGYLALEAGEVWPDWITYNGIADLFGWPRSFVRGP